MYHSHNNLTIIKEFIGIFKPRELMVNKSSS